MSPISALSPLSMQPPPRRNKRTTPLDGSQITFSNKIIFDKDFSKKTSHADVVVAKMMNGNVLNMNGSLDKRDEDAFRQLSRSHLWLYIYYLWFHNHKQLELFGKMTRSGPIVRACAPCFVNVIKEYLRRKNYLIIEDTNVLSREQLVHFLDHLFADYGDNIRVPLLEHIYERILLKQEEYHKLLTGENNELDMEIEELQRKLSEQTNETRVVETDVYTLDSTANPIVVRSKDPKIQPLSLKIKVTSSELS